MATVVMRDIIVIKELDRLGRNKQENLSGEQKRLINDWKNKKLKLRDCIKLTGLSSSTLYRIKNK